MYRIYQLPRVITRFRNVNSHYKKLDRMSKRILSNNSSMTWEQTREVFVFPETLNEDTISKTISEATGFNVYKKQVFEGIVIPTISPSLLKSYGVYLPVTSPDIKCLTLDPFRDYITFTSSKSVCTDKSPDVTFVDKQEYIEAIDSEGCVFRIDNSKIFSDVVGDHSTIASLTTSDMYRSMLVSFVIDNFNRGNTSRDIYTYI